MQKICSVNGSRATLMFRPSFIPAPHPSGDWEEKPSLPRRCSTAPAAPAGAPPAAAPVTRDCCHGTKDVTDPDPEARNTTPTWTSGSCSEEPPGCRAQLQSCAAAPPSDPAGSRPPPGLPLPQ